MPLYWEEIWRSTELKAWSSYLRNPFAGGTLRQWWENVSTKISWTSCGSKNHRKAAWFVAKGCSCEYKYSGTVWNPTVFPEWLTDITLQVMEKVGWPKTIKTLPNCCNINLYENGNEIVPWHSDDEALFNGLWEKCTIISLSLGASRTFQIKRKRGRNPVRSIVLNNGDLLTMEGMFQKFLKHQLKKYIGVLDKRINITWR